VYCAVYKQNKNTLIFPHKIGCVNIGGNSCIQTNRKMHPNSNIALGSRRETASTHKPAALVAHAWYKSSKAVLHHAMVNAAVEEAALELALPACVRGACPFPDLLPCSGSVRFTNTLKGVS